MRENEGEHGFLSRRGFIKVAGGAAAAAAIASCTSEQQALGFEPEQKNRTPFITPNEDFYLVAVDTSFRPPVNERTVEQDYSLTIRGPGGDTVELPYSQLADEAQGDIGYTFECIGNTVGGTLIGNAVWRGARLRDVLERSGMLTSNVQSVMFIGFDEFYSSISIDRVLDDYSFLATHMNGVPLPPEHGFPVRTILPNLYGMKQPRWLKRIELQETAETTSYWEKRGWAGEVPVKTMSRLDPVSDVRAGQSTEVTGIAFAGSRGIRGVEVSLDNGESWQRCRLEQGGTPNEWATWSYDWTTPVPGNYTLRVRAIDGTGEVQTAGRTRAAPDGATGHDSARTTVKEA